MKKHILTLGLVILCLNVARGQVVPTNEWVSFWSDSSRINGNPLPVGAVVRAYDPQGVLCGEFTVKTAGAYGMMPVYRDDATTPSIDEGVQPGDLVSFTVNDVAATPSGPGNAVWTASGDVIKLNLVVETPEIELTPAVLSFGNVTIGSSASLPMTATNVGPKDLRIDSIAAVYRFTNDLSVSTTSATVAPGGSESITVRFSPTIGLGNMIAQIIVYSNAWNAPRDTLTVTASIQTDVVSTNEWVTFWGESTTLDGQAVKPGDVVDAYDPQHVHCGTFLVAKTGGYGLMPVYRDDPTTPSVDEGASPGDHITFKINGRAVYPIGPDSPVWTANGAVLRVNLTSTSLVPPTLLSPATGSTGVAANPTLAWNTVAAAASYRLQLSTDSSFATRNYDRDGITSTSITVDGLSNMTKFYWRVRAANVGGTSGWSDTWNFTTAPSLPLPPILLGPPDSSSGTAVNLTLFWNASANADAYSVQVATEPSFGLIVFNETGITATSVSVTELSYFTRYYWRVRAANAAGTSAWSTVWNFVTGLPIPSPPALLSPADNSTRMPTNPTFVWNSSSGAASYRLQLSTNTSFNPIAYDTSGITSTFKMVSGLSNMTKYYWRMNATGAGGTSAWSAVRNFTTIVGIPKAPILSKPENNSTAIAVSPTLTWDTSAGAVSYRLQVSTDTSFGTTLYDSSEIIATSRTITGLSNMTKYCWRVNATNERGTGPWSDVWNFTTITVVPAIPKLVSPPSDAKNQPLSLTLQIDSVSTAAGYNWQVSAEEDFNSTVADDSTGAGNTSHTVLLAAGTKFYWRARAYNEAGASAFSGPDSFMTIGVPGMPKLLYPENGAQNVNVDGLELGWNSSPNATGYHLQISPESGFSPSVVDEADVSDTTATVGGLANMTKYFWRVNAHNVAGESAFSEVDSFTTIVAAPMSPILRSPSGTMGEARKTTFMWGCCENATAYHIQIATSSKLESSGEFVNANVVFDSTLSDTTSRLSTPLPPSTKHYWHVSAIGVGGVSAYSGVEEFTTGSGIDAVSEANGAPREFALYQNYPNPFNPTTTIKFEVPSSGFVSLKMYDILGREVKTLVDEVKKAGRYEVKFDGTALSGGVYLYSIRAGSFVKTMKVVLLR